MKKGKLLQFPKKFEAEKEAMEGGLQRVFWANVDKDMRRVAKLYLARHAGATVDAEEYAQHLVAFRHDQGHTPSAHISKLQRVFLLATISQRDKMHQLFCEEKTALMEHAIKYDDPRYEAAVQQAVVNDTSEVISFAVDTWFSEENRKKIFKTYQHEHSEDCMINILLEALKERVPTNGADLRMQVEMRTGRAMKDDYKEPRLELKEPAALLRFPTLAAGA